MLFASAMEWTTLGMPRHAQTEEAWLKFVFGAISLLAFIIAWQIVNGLWQRYYASSHPYVKENDLVTLSNHALTCLSPSVSLITSDNVEQGRRNIADGCCLGPRPLLFQRQREQANLKCLAHFHLSTFLASEANILNLPRRSRTLDILTLVLQQRSCFISAYPLYTQSFFQKKKRKKSGFQLKLRKTMAMLGFTVTLNFQLQGQIGEDEQCHFQPL